MAEKKWYIVHTYSTYELKAKKALEERIKVNNMEDRFGEIVVPMQDEIVRKDGKQKTRQVQFFPGYILVRMQLDDETWHIVRGTPRISGFVGNAKNPPSLPDDEVDRILTRIKEGGGVKLTSEFDAGDNVRVINGPFMNFVGVIDEIMPGKNKARILLDIFGRQTPVELTLDYIERETAK